MQKAMARLLSKSDLTELKQATKYEKLSEKVD